MPPVVRETPDPISVLTIHLGLSATHDVRLGQEHEVEAPGARERLPAEGLAQQPTCAVAFHGPAEAATHRQAQADERTPVGCR